MRKAANVRGHLGVEPGLLAKLRNKVRIGQEADVEHHIGVERHTVLEAEAEAGDQQLLGLFLVAKALQDVGAQLVYVEIRSVNQRVGDVANGVQQLPLLHNGARNSLRPAQRVRPPCFRVAAHQHRVLRIQKNHSRREQLAHALQYLGQAVQRGSFANIHHDRRALNLARCAYQRGKIRQQFERQVVHGVIAQIFKSLQG